METFWNTIADYNLATWGFQILLVAFGAVLTILLYFRPTHTVRVVMKLYMILLNFWIAIVYYLIYCAPREYNELMALFWAIMGALWIYDLVVKHSSLELTGRHPSFAVVLLVMPLVYPLLSLAMGRSFPMMTSPILPCSVVVFTIGLMLAFSERVNIILAMFLAHWALLGFSKIYFFGIIEDYILVFSLVPAMYIFFREYIITNTTKASKPSPRVLNGLLILLCLIVGAFFTMTLLNQFGIL